MKKPGDSTFIAELKAKQAGKTARRRLDWDKPFAKPLVDENFPAAKLKAAPTAKEKASPVPGADLPTKLNGSPDLAQIREDLTTQLKNQKRR